MTTLTFTIAFHGPFHVGSGVPEQGLDRVLDRERLLPASSLKGLMRAEALERLLVDPVLVGAVFGTYGPRPANAAPSRRRTESPWVWSDAVFEPLNEGAFVRRGARIQIDDASGTVARGFLMIGESVWAREATFTIDLRQTMSDDDLAAHRLVLRAAGRSVSALGGGRRRGEGWVSVTEPASWGDDDSEALLELRGGR